MSGDEAGDPDGAWVSVAEAARRLGLTPKAVRNRIAREQIEWRPRGNEGREVWLPAGDAEGPGPAQAGDQGAKALLDAVDRAARAEGELVGVREALAEARARAGAAGDRAGAAEAEVARLRRALAEALKPWWRRWLAGDGAGGRPGDLP